MNSIKIIGRFLGGACILAQSLIAAPLDKSYVGKDAKWLAHIDVEALMKISIAELAVDRLKAEMAANNDSVISVDVDMVLAEIKSITAYGERFGEDGDIDGVLIVQTGDRFQTIVDGLIAHQELESDGEFEMKRLEDKPFVSYLLEDELYITFPRKDLLIAGKQFDRIEAAYEVVRGKSENLGDAADTLLLNQDEGFFLVATATGLDRLKNVPPQARILQKTKGGQFSIGEDADDFRANLVLSTASRDVSTQLYRIVQGMIALASFAQVDNQGIMDVVNRVEVRQGDNWVSVDFRYPMDEVMKLVGGLMEGHGGQSHEEDHAEGSPQSWHEPRGGDGNSEAGELLAMHLAAAMRSHD